MRNHHDVVIIGGGAAGIGAARELAGTGLSTLLLEAAPRLGGRAHTQRAAGLALDLGCGWLHSADRNAWVGIAQARGIAIDRRPAAWGTQYHDLGITPYDLAAARTAFAAWVERMRADPPPSDRASDALDPACRWNDHIAAMTGFISGVAPDRISVADYLAYDDAATDRNWRVATGYGALIAGSLPPGIDHRTATPVERLSLDGKTVRLTTPAGDVTADTVILTVSTAVLAGDSIAMPAALDPWREAARCLPLGRNEKLFLQIMGDTPFETETQVLGRPGDRRTGSHYIRPLGAPVIECFLGGDGAAVVADEGVDAAFTCAIDELAGLFGADIRRSLRPLIASDWTRLRLIGGAYSCALPGHADARRQLAHPYDDRVFFAGEATDPQDFSTAHGACASSARAAREVVQALARR